MDSEKSLEHSLSGTEAHNSTPDPVDEEKTRNLNQKENINQGLEDKDPEVEKQSIEEAEAKDAPVDEANDGYASGKALVPIIGALVLVVFLVSLDMTIIGTAIPKITDEFHGLSEVSWYGSAYFMTFGGFQSASGKFYKYFPLKTSFLASIVLFEIGSLICGVAQNSTTFIVGRAFAGLGAAGQATGAFTIVAFTVRPRMRPSMLGLIGGVYGMSSVLGPILGGVFADSVTWRWCFYINLPIGGLSILLIFLFFKQPAAAKPVPASHLEKFLQMDPIGMILVMGGIISFILAFQYAGLAHAWNSSVVIGLIVGCVLMWVVFICWEIYIGDRAVIPPRLFKQRWIWQPSIYQFFLAGPYFLLLYYLPIYFQSVDNISPIASGVRNLPLVIGVVIGSIASGGIVTKTGHAAPFMVGGAVLATVATGLMTTFKIGTGHGAWIGYQALYGLATGACFQMAVNIAQANAEPQDVSSVTAIIYFLQILGGAFCISASQSAFENRLITTLAKTVPDLDPSLVIATGATQIRVAFPAYQVPGIVEAYMAGLKVDFQLAVSVTAVSVLMCVLVPWQRINMGAAAGGAA